MKNYSEPLFYGSILLEALSLQHNKKQYLKLLHLKFRNVISFINKLKFSENLSGFK